MKVRKLIKFGKNSFVVSVPKTWVEKNKIQKGDMVYVNENGNNEIVLTHQFDTNQKVKLRNITINVDNSDLHDIKREINSAYVNNYHVIRIEGKSLEKKVRDVRNILSNLVALEVVEQTNNHIEARDFLNMKKISIHNTIRKIDGIVRSMIVDSKMMFESDAYESLLVRDEDVNRLVSLVVRVSRYALKKPHLVQDTKLSPFDFYRFLTIADCMERIGDETKRISRFLRKVDFTKEQEENFVKIYSRLESIYKNAAEAFYTNDAAAALALAREDRKLQLDCDAFMVKCSAHYTALLMDKMKRMADLTHIIGREVYQGDFNGD